MNSSTKKISRLGILEEFLERVLQQSQQFIDCVGLFRSFTFSSQLYTPYQLDLKNISKLRTWKIIVPRSLSCWGSPATNPFCEASSFALTNRRLCFLTPSFF
jgi:hypothetical protein